MVSTFHGLELGKRGLAVAQTSISTTGHNIANANTAGYSRQQVNSSASPSLDVWASGEVNPSQLGTGALVDSITRVRDRFLDQQYRNQSGALGEWTVKQETLGQIEAAMNEPSETGLRASMDQLSAAWKDLANDPSSPAAQTVLKERARAFVEVAQSMDSSMAAISEDLNRQQTAAIEQANGYLGQIAELNKNILQSGSHSNDLLDKRDKLVEELSAILPVSVTEQKNGVYNISLPAGTVLVEGIEQKASITAADGTTGGKLAGINESIAMAADYRSQLTSTVKDFAVANGMSAASGPASGLFTGDEAGFTIEGLGVNAQMADYAAPQGMEENTGKAQSAFRTLISKLGVQSQSAANSTANHEAALLATENRRQSVTGVSIDEEMANLIKFQHSYNAAARLVTTADEMLDTIINRMAAR